MAFKLNSELYAAPPGRGHLRLLDVGGGARGGKAPLHVTSTGCDDLVAVSLCAGALGALSLHGFRPEGAGLPADT